MGVSRMLEVWPEPVSVLSIWRDDLRLIRDQRAEIGRSARLVEPEE